MTDGILLIDKPTGVTSHDVVGKIRRLFGTRQVGHTGTLDPIASGLLVLMVGRAVKASEYACEDGKRYTAGLTLGLTTDTEDITGRVLSRADALPDADAVIAAAGRFTGEILQVPPMYSALKQGGQKLYELARRGITVDREPRPVTVFSLRCEPVEPDAGRYRLTVDCSRGTYIRTLCADIGKALGCGGVMSSLRRERVGEFSLDGAITPETLEALSPEEREAKLLPTERLFDRYPALTLPPFFAGLARSGCEIYLKKIGADLPIGQRVRLCDSTFFALGEVKEYEAGPAVKAIKQFRI